MTDELKAWAEERAYERAKAEYTEKLDRIRAEIEQTADEEQKHDKKWALGLRYAVKIIDKYAACGGEIHNDEFRKDTFNDARRADPMAQND